MRLGYVLLGLVALTSIQTSCGQCSNGFAGVQKDDICCDAACGTCGGGGCGRRPGGQESCCTSGIRESGMMCDTTMAAPCIVNSIPNPGDVCSNGLPGVQSGDICCDSSCGTCGGSGCGARPGGSSSCCSSRIRDSAVMCDTSLTAPCIANEDSPRSGCLNPTTSRYQCSFSGSTSLLFEECDLSDRDVPFLPACFEAFGRSNIQRLDFEIYGAISAFPEDLFSGMTELTILQMDNSIITAVPEGLFAGLTKLEFLDMSASRLVSLPETIFSDLASLQILDLSCNALSLEALPIGLFSGTPLLQELDLGDNNLLLTEDTFSGLVNLETLDLGSNGLTTLPTGVFAPLVNLVNLNLGSNDLLLPENAFADLVNLETLFLHRNGLTTLPTGVFSPLVNLVNLYLGGNDLLLTDDAFSELVNVETLDLGSNGLTTLPTGVFAPLVNLVNLDVKFNFDLQCLPSSTATDIDVSNNDVLDGTCECTPVEAVFCDDGFTCQSGMTGYTCVAE